MCPAQLAIWRDESRPRRRRALGIAVLGSLNASAYRANLGDAIAGLPEETAAAPPAAPLRTPHGSPTPTPWVVAFVVAAAVAIVAIAVVRRYLPVGQPVELRPRAPAPPELEHQATGGS